jgi:hypothetical protein
MYEIHLFLGTASAGKENKFAYAPGERHAVLVFSRQPIGTEHDWQFAASHLEGAGWTHIELQRAKNMDAPNLNTDPTFSTAYEKALAQGGTVIVYTDPVDAQS